MHAKPLFYVLIPFTVGLLSGLYIPTPIFIPALSTPVLLFLLLPFTFGKRKYALFIKWQTLYYTLCCLLLFSIGSLHVKLYQIRHSPPSISEERCREKNYFTALIDDLPIQKEKSIQLNMRLLEHSEKGLYSTLGGRVQILLACDSLSENLRYGDLLLLYTKFSCVVPPSNPKQFDYKHYLSLKQITHSAYLLQTDWRKLHHHPRSTLLSFAYQLRGKCLAIIENSILGKKEKSLAEALLLGWNESMNRDDLHSFATAGISHLLCVSGLHTGIVYLLLGYVLFFLNTKPQLKVLKILLQVCAVWFFALLTGFSASVVRASIMISFLAFSKAIQRPISIYQSIAVAAWILLLRNPYEIINPGFQLSFSAVIGIICFQPLFSKPFAKCHRLLKYPLELCSVSLAAQLATLPFCLYYFHQFPSYFLIGNLLTIPLAGITIVSACLFLFLQYIPILSELLQWIYSSHTNLLGKISSTIENLPYALHEQIPFNLPASFCLGLSILFLVIASQTKRKLAIFLSFLLLLSFFLYDTVDLLFKRQQQLFIVYHLANKGSAIEFMNGKNSLLLYSKKTGDNLVNLHQLSRNFRTSRRIQKYIQSNWNDPSPETEKIPFLFRSKNYYVFAGKKILICDENFVYHEELKKLHFDFLLLCSNPKVRREELLTLNFHNLIIDATNSKKNTEIWQKATQDQNRNCFIIRDKGAFLWEKDASSSLN